MGCNLLVTLHSVMYLLRVSTLLIGFSDYTF